MKDPEERKDPESSVKIGISMPAWILKFAKARAYSLGYSTFSAYIQSLIYTDHQNPSTPHSRRPTRYQ
jgi:hypothetical protein